MKTIIINGQRELEELPEVWYTDGTEEANEWLKKLINSDYSDYIKESHWPFIGANKYGVSFGGEISDHTYITPSEFLRLVYEPWKEGQKVKLPSNYVGVCSILTKVNKAIIGHTDYFPKHIQACAKLTNIMNYANDAFEGGDKEWNIWSYGLEPVEVNHKNNPIRFTSKAAAEWAYKTFPEIFKAYWNV
jgi:hypothetical protein